MVGSGSVSGRAGGKKFFKPENPSARKRKKNEEEDKDIVILESSSSSSSESEPEEESDSERERGEEEEDSDDEEIRLLFVEKVASRNGEKGAGKVGKMELNNEKRGGGSSSKSSGKEIDKKKDKGKMKAVVEDEERRGKKEAKNLKKKEKKVVVEEEEEEEDGKGEREEGWECKFPMNRVSKIMKDRDGSVRLAQEAIFLANKASEKFLELYCREAYACAFLDHKKQVSYDHLASVVSKRKRFDFLSGPPVDWANIEKFAGAMKNLEQSAKDPPSPPKNSAVQESSRPDISRGLKRQKSENDVPTSSNSMHVSFPVEFESSSAPGKTSEESPPPSPLETVSGLKLMSLLQNMNMLSFEMISRRNTRQILKDLGEKPDDLDHDQKEPKVAATTTRRSSEVKAETSTKYQSTART